MPKVIVSLSGGMDSATVLASALEATHEVARAVNFIYGSKHNALENEAASAVAAHYKIPFQVIDMTSTFVDFKSDLLNTGGAIPEGHYESESMKRTVVPARNIIFTSVLAGLAVSLEASQVWLGIHAGDHAIYPDCRPEFYRAMREAVYRGTDGEVSLVAPFLCSKKHQILSYGFGLGVPYQLTRTCYTNDRLACGKCGSCQERLEAFALCDAKDPVAYKE